MKIVKLLLAVLLCLTGLFPLAAEAKTDFNDVKQDYWARDYIYFLFDQEVIFGYPNGDFGTEDPIRRVDAAAMIVRALDLDTDDRPNPNFTDIDSNSYGYETIAAVTEEGIFSGNGTGMFQSNNTLSRAEMAAIVTRAFELEGKNASVSFKDVSSTAWHYDYIKALVANEITTGYPDQTFRPNQPISRAEFSTFMARVIQQMPTEEVEEEYLEVIEIY